MVAILQSERVVIAVKMLHYNSKVIQVLFGQSDGSLYVNFPYFKHSKGLISLVTLTSGTTYPTNIDLTPGGKVTSHLVKYAHHPDGRVHFSQDGKVLSIVRKQSIPLAEAEGHLFTVQLQGLQGFQPVDVRKDFSAPTPRKTVVTFELKNTMLNYDTFKLLGHWYSMSKFTQNTVGSPSGPLLPVVKPDGQMIPGVVISAPPNYRFSDRVLLVTIENVPKLTEEEDTVLTFVGGFDPPSVILDLSVNTSFLSLSYPASDYSALKLRLGSADLPAFRRKSSEI